jgi:hypothetical protein
VKITLLSIFGALVIAILPAVCAESEKQFTPTDVGTYEVSMKTNPSSPQVGKETSISFEVLTKLTRQPQAHVDYEVLISKDNQAVFSTGSGHTHNGLTTMSYNFESSGKYVISILINGIVFSPIPTETSTFNLVVGDIGGSSDKAEKPKTTMTEPKTKTSIPNWIKQIAEFWVTNKIADTEFVQVIEYLVQKGIITIPYAEAPEGETAVEIPSWIKTNAKFWIDGKISDDEFAIGLEWLINNGIIRI